MVKGLSSAGLSGQRDLGRHQVACERQIARRRCGHYSWYRPHSLQGLPRIRREELPPVWRECSVNRDTGLDADDVLWIEAEIDCPQADECLGEEHRADKQHQTYGELAGNDQTLQTDIDAELLSSAPRLP